MIRGVYAALITPFDKNENIDEKACETIINWTIGKGVTGVFTVSSTGESWALSFEEKARLFQLTVSVTQKRTPGSPDWGRRRAKRFVYRRSTEG
jgi:dihydrodipicolinate synthase/N-acetylneuraminate lyase